MSLKVVRFFNLLVLVLSFNIAAISKIEKNLFTIKLNKSENPSNLLEYNRNEGLRSIVAGPIVMSKNRFLFFSDNGYLLYDQKGVLLDSSSLFKENSGLSEDDSARLRLAFPLDANTLIYYRRVKDQENPLKIFFKKIDKGRFKELKHKNNNPYKDIEHSELQNILFNTITDEMASTFMSQRYLVGFRGSTSMWTLDSYYSSTSPIIVSKEESFISFYPGVRMGKSKKHQLLVNPLQAFKKEGKWYYTGIHSNVGGNDSLNYQKIFFYDDAGNSLWNDTIVKQVNENVIIGEDHQTYYTAKKIRKYVYIPSVDNNGNIYYGIYDFKKGIIQVVEKTFNRIKAVKTKEQLKDLIDRESVIEAEAVKIPCGRETPGKQIAKVTLLDAKGRRVSGQIRHLEKDGYIARISRIQYRDIYRKLARKRTDIPMYVSLFMDSLSEESEAGCPYYVSLSGPKGMIRSFDYPFGTEVASARVLALQKNEHIVIRVDCMKYAEILILDKFGNFIERFVFNNQQFKKRKDIVVASKEGKIIELDYETLPGSKTYFSWQ